MKRILIAVFLVTLFPLAFVLTMALNDSELLEYDDNGNELPKAAKTPVVRPVPKLEMVTRPWPPFEPSLCDLINMKVSTLKINSRVYSVGCRKMQLNGMRVSISLRARVGWSRGTRKQDIRKDIGKVIGAVIAFDVQAVLVIVKASFRGHSNSRWFKIASCSFDRAKNCKGKPCSYSIRWQGGAL